jgi:hypothetical protein
MENDGTDMDSSKKEQYLKKLLLILLVIWLSTNTFYFLNKPSKLETLKQEEVSNSLNITDGTNWEYLKSIHVFEGDKIKTLENPSGTFQPGIVNRVYYKNNDWYVDIDFTQVFSPTSTEGDIYLKSHQCKMDSPEDWSFTYECSNKLVIFCYHGECITNENRSIRTFPLSTGTPVLTYYGPTNAFNQIEDSKTLDGKNLIPNRGELYSPTSNIIADNPVQYIFKATNYFIGSAGVNGELPYNFNTWNYFKIENNEIEVILEQYSS